MKDSEKTPFQTISELASVFSGFSPKPIRWPYRNILLY